jgi:hypothetical protein
VRLSFENEVIIMAARAPTIPQKSKAAAVPKEEQIRQQADERSLPLEERIRLRPYEIYLECGGQDGSDVDHWLEAEAEVLAAQEEV